MKKRNKKVAAPLEEFMNAQSDEYRKLLLTALFEPSDTCSLEASAETKNYLVLSALENVATSLRFWKLVEGEGFVLERQEQAPMGMAPSVSAVNAEEGDAIWMTSEGYTQPTTLAIAEASAPDEQEPLKALPSFFDATGLKAQQHYATSDDGTKVPYFLVCKEDLPLDGSTPTLLYGYGGFEVGLVPLRVSIITICDDASLTGGWAE